MTQDKVKAEGFLAKFSEKDIMEDPKINSKILIVGQLPPPYHGSNVMAKGMLSALALKGYKTIFIDKLFAKSIDTIGKPSLRKILRVPVLAIEIIVVCLFKRPVMCIYFIAVGKSAFIIDALLLLLIRSCRVPYILRFGGKGYRELQDEGFIWKFIVSRTLSNALGGIVLGQIMKRDVNMFISNHKLVYVPNGVTVNNIEPNRKDNKHVQILYLSNLVPSKGALEYLKAANIVIRKHHNVRFILAGVASSQSFADRLRSYIVSNKLHEYVQMPGGVIGEQKEKLMASSDIFVFPSYFRYEVFGTVNIEAMGFGLPVISSKEGAISETVEDGVSGFIIDPKSPEDIADKISILVNNPDLRQKMGIKGREIFKSKYTLEAYARNLDYAIMYFGDILKGIKN
jgi:glycosyltransferase involved in cell wall biosynthesis